MRRFALAAAAMLLALAPVLALDGEPGMHDPSTVIEAGGKFYVYATGNGLPVFQSDDDWTWHRAGSDRPLRYAVFRGLFSWFRFTSALCLASCCCWLLALSFLPPLSPMWLCSLRSL